MVYLLIAHIGLGFALLGVFVARFISVITNRTTPKRGRKTMGLLSLGLISSGVALVITTHAPLTGACLSSLLIIAIVSTLEYSLLLADKKNPSL